MHLAPLQLHSMGRPRALSAISAMSCCYGAEFDQTLSRSYRDQPGEVGICPFVGKMSMPWANRCGSSAGRWRERSTSPVVNRWQSSREEGLEDSCVGSLTASVTTVSGLKPSMATRDLPRATLLWIVPGCAYSTRAKRSETSSPAACGRQSYTNFPGNLSTCGRHEDPTLTWELCDIPWGGYQLHQRRAH
jgi:hypothetical protein